MSNRNAELLKPVYDAWARGDFRPRHDAYGADLEWGWSDEFPDLGEIKSEPEPRSERLQRWFASWERWHVVPEEYLPAGDDMVLVLCRFTGRGKGSGVRVDEEGAHLWTFAQGRANRLVIFSNRELARAAAGLDG